MDRKLGKNSREEGPLSYEAARAKAADPDPWVRRTLAARTDLPPEILYYLAEDSDLQVRVLIAGNEAAPRHADLLLARDAEPEVRAILAGKIAQLAPLLSAENQDKLHRMAYEALEILTRDQITRVRQILAEAIKDVAKAPPEVVRSLARDAEIVVAGPILQFSPVLTDSDLLEIIAQRPAEGGLVAIARRRDLGERVSDAVAAQEDVEAVTALLANASAQIREETLDRLVEKAARIEAWQEPLVERRGLHGRAAIKLARIVASELLFRLKARTDFDDATLTAIAATVARRVEEEGGDGGMEIEPETAALQMLDAGTLDEAALTDKMEAGERAFVIAGLALLAEMSPVAVKRILINRSAKGSVALAWKAGLSPDFAEALQRRLALVADGSVLTARDGQFPLSEDEMSWQIELFAAMGADRPA